MSHGPKQVVGEGVADDALGERARLQARELQHYWSRVLKPALAGVADDGELATFLNGEIEQWEAELRRDTPSPGSKETVALLSYVLTIVRLRIFARVTAAEHKLGDVAGAAV